MAKVLLEVKDLTIRFPDSSPVRNLDFVIRQGETVAIVGESGSGKSRTALALMRLLRKTALISNGSMNYAGQDWISLSDRAIRAPRRRDIALIFPARNTPLRLLRPIWMP